MNLKTRLWWQPARKAVDRRDDRSVSFLELFYDLVYVVLVAQVTHAFAAHLDLKHLGHFVFLFTIVWWAWLNGTTYHEYHGNNDIRTRLFTFAQMFAVAGMAVFAHSAMGEGSRGFAFCYGLFQLILSILWWRLAVHDPEHHVANRPFVIAFSMSTLLFFASIFVATPFRFYMWTAAVLLSLLQPLVMFVLRPRVYTQSHHRALHFSPALVERFGLFNILVLAEVVVGVVNGLAERHHLVPLAFGVAGLGLCIAIMMWWLYFDFVSHRHPHAGQANGATWIYMHLFISLSIAMTGATVLNVVEHAGEPLEPTVRWLLVSAVATYVLCLVPLMRVIQILPQLRTANNLASTILASIALVIVLLGFTTLNALPLLVIIVVLMAVPVVYAVVIWVQVLEAQDTRHQPSTLHAADTISPT
ncbi:MAG: low temperature requirement protein A [Deinococcota bacterium]